MVLPIIAYGDSVLRKVAEEIEENHNGLKKTLDDMFETMYAANGVGLAAPQVGKSIRIFVIDASSFAEPDDDGNVDEKGVGLENFKKVFINPIIEEEFGDEWAFNEGCLSIPDIREEVMRPEKLIITYFDENWEFHEEEYDGYAARIIQHEYDHLEGVLFTDKVGPLKRRLLKRKLTDISKGITEAKYRMSFPKAR